MIRADQIPDEVVEAAARALHSQWITNNCTPDDRHEYREWEHLISIEREDIMKEARASIAAALNAWPGAELEHDIRKEPRTIHLPIQEASDDA